MDVDHGAIHTRIPKSEVEAPSNERLALVLNAAKLYDLIPGMNDSVLCEQSVVNDTRGVGVATIFPCCLF